MEPLVSEFANLSFVTQNIAMQNVKRLETKIKSALDRALVFDKLELLQTSFDSYFKEEKLLSNLGALLGTSDKETFEAALLYRKCRRALKKMLIKIERLEVLHAEPAEKENVLNKRKEAVAARAEAMKKKVTRHAPTSSASLLDFSKLYEAVEATRQTELDKLKQTTAEWTAFTVGSCEVTLYRDGKSFIHLNHLLGSGVDKRVFLVINYESNSLAVHNIAGFNKNVNRQQQPEVEILEGVKKTPRIACIKKKRINATAKGWFTNYCNQGDMFDFTQAGNEFKKFNAKEHQSFVESIIECVSTVHKNKIIHRDVKVENFLVHTLNSISRAAKLHLISITDFGLSRKENFYDYSYPGSEFYGAPEVILGKMRPTYESDLFSLGASIGYCYGMPVKEAGKKIIFLNKSEKNTLQSLIMNLMKDVPSERLRTEEAFEAVKNIRWHSMMDKWDVKIASLF